MVSIRPRWLRSPRWLLCAAMGICLWLALGPGVACAWEPGLTWQTLDTPHFRVHFHDEEEALARRAASKLEVIHGVMTEEIGWTPRRLRCRRDSNSAWRWRGPWRWNRKSFCWMNPPLRWTRNRRRS